MLSIPSLIHSLWISFNNRGTLDKSQWLSRFDKDYCGNKSCVFCVLTFCVPSYFTCLSALQTFLLFLSLYLEYFRDFRVLVLYVAHYLFIFFYLCYLYLNMSSSLTCHNICSWLSRFTIISLMLAINIIWLHSINRA